MKTPRAAQLPSYNIPRLCCKDLYETGPKNAFHLADVGEVYLEAGLGSKPSGLQCDGWLAMPAKVLAPTHLHSTFENYGGQIEWETFHH